MQRQMLKSKVHRATITACDPDYVGSITIDPELMRSADLLANEQVHVWDIEKIGVSRRFDPHDSPSGFLLHNQGSIGPQFI